MKLSKSKLALAKVINENGGWPQDSEWAVQNGDHGRIGFSINKPVRHDSKSWMTNGGFNFKIEVCKPLKNWHLNVLSREEYYQAYPKADSDGWIEWKGGECPVDVELYVYVNYRDGCELPMVVKAGSQRWDHFGLGGDIVSYRLRNHANMHDTGAEDPNPVAEPEFCESVTRSIQEPGAEAAKYLLAKNLGAVGDAIFDSIVVPCGTKVTGENRHQHVDAKPAIEQLAQDYRNKLDLSNRKQQEADDAKNDAEAKLAELVAAGKAIGLLVSPITAKQEPEPVAVKFTGKFHSAKHGDRPSDLDMICDGCGKRFGHHVGFDCRP